MNRIREFASAVRYLTLFPKNYVTPQGLSSWGEVVKEYGNTKKKIRCSRYHWRVITYKDGHKELTYLRVKSYAGSVASIYRGLLIPKVITYGTFANIDNIEIAF